jgi:hypothetical protein
MDSALKRLPLMAQHRAEIADIYRKLRKHDGHAMARLLYQRERACVHELSERMLENAAGRWANTTASI